MTTTSYGSWAHNIADGSLTVEQHVTVALGEFVADYDVPGLIAAYRDAIAEVLPAGVTLAGDEFIGPAPRRTFASHPIDGFGEQDFKLIVEAVDFWSLARRFEKSTDNGTLTDYVTGRSLRPATRDEWSRSVNAGETGAFKDGGGRFLFVAGGPDPDPDPIAVAVARLEAIDGTDFDAAHGEADEILLSVAPVAVVDAYRRLVERAPTWANA